MKFRTFNSVVQDICAINLNDERGRKAGLVGRTLRNVLSEWSFYLPMAVKAQFFPISSAFTIQLPTDCLVVSKVGVMCGDRLKLFGRNEDVWRQTGEPLCSCDVVSTDAASSSCAACTFHNVQFGNKYGEAYAYRSDPWAGGEYRYDSQTNTLQFSSGDDVAEGMQVLVEYKCDDASTFALIPSTWVNLLGFRVAQILNISVNGGVAQLNEREYQRSYSGLVRAWNHFRPEELISALRGQSMGAPKL